MIRDDRTSISASRALALIVAVNLVAALVAVFLGGGNGIDEWHAEVSSSRASGSWRIRSTNTHALGAYVRKAFRRPPTIIALLMQWLSRLTRRSGDFPG